MPHHQQNEYLQRARADRYRDQMAIFIHSEQAAGLEIEAKAFEQKDLVGGNCFSKSSSASPESGVGSSEGCTAISNNVPISMVRRFYSSTGEFHPHGDAGCASCISSNKLHPGARPALYQYRQYLKRCWRFVGKSREGRRSGDWGFVLGVEAFVRIPGTFFRRKKDALVSRRDGTIVARQFIAWTSSIEKSVP